MFAFFTHTFLSGFRDSSLEGGEDVLVRMIVVGMVTGVVVRVYASVILVGVVEEGRG